MIRLQSTEPQSGEPMPTPSPASLRAGQRWPLSFGLGLTLVVTFGLLGAGCYYFLHRLVLAPLASLRSGIARLSRGDQDYRILVTAGDASGTTATAFNQLADQLAASEEALQRAHQDWELRLQERTAALAAANAELRNEVEVRRAAESALRESELRYRQLFEAAPVGIFTKSITGRYTGVNAAERAYWPSDPTGYTDAEVEESERAASEQRSDGQLVERGEAVVSEQQVRTANGLRTILTYKALLYDSEGQASGILGVDLDITGRRQAELALVETETKYRALVEQMPAITYTATLGSEFNTTYISPRVALLGFTPEEWVNNSGLFLKQLHPDDHQRVTSQLAQIQAAGQPVEIEYRLLTRDGRLLWISDQAHLLYDSAGQAIGRQGLMFDITQRKAAEEALRDSVHRIELIADNLPALIAYVDDQQVYRFANRQFEEWYATPDIVGRDLRAIAGDQQYQGIRDYVDTALAGTPITFDYARLYPDGQQRFVEIAYIPHVGPEGRVLGFFTLVQDVTERKVAEEQIKASLEEKVVLLKEIHHRVKNNLQVISSLLSLQSEQIDNPQVRASLQDSQNRVRSMALIHEKLYQAQDQVRVDVAEYIQNLTSYLFRSYATLASGIQLKVKVDNVYLGIDAAMPCGLIINELLSNALKHAFPNGAGGEVYVDLRHDADGLYTLLVGDTGVGMPVDLVWYKSASLGLQLVHTLVKQLDGMIKVRRDHGVEFCIRFSDAR